ncbi:hypothetical protein BgiMline_030142, partial [Biomphalaria glabrata]
MKIMANFGLTIVFVLLCTGPVAVDCYWREFGGAVGGGLLAAGLVAGVVSVPLVGPVVIGYTSI